MNEEYANGSTIVIPTNVRCFGMTYPNRFLVYFFFAFVFVFILLSSEDVTNVDTFHSHYFFLKSNVLSMNSPFWNECKDQKTKEAVEDLKAGGKETCLAQNWALFSSKHCIYD